MEDIIKRLEKELEKSEVYLKNEISTLSAGRATPSLVENIMIDYYGVPTPLKQVATISVPEPRNILIQPWDKKQLKEIEKAIRMAQLGFNPINDGEAIRIVVPQPTEERRKELARHVRRILEKAKISVRNAREEAIREIKKLEKEGAISEDDRFRKQDEIQRIVDSCNKRLEENAKKKEEEIMTV